MNGFLLDTNVISELAKPKPDPKVFAWVKKTDRHSCYLSVLTIGEIKKGLTLLADPKRRIAIETWLEKDLRSYFEGRILPINDDIADQWGTLSGQLHLIKKPVPVIDGLLAATAIHHHLTLVTRNTKDVKDTNVLLLNPWQ